MKWKKLARKPITPDMDVYQKEIQNFAPSHCTYLRFGGNVRRGGGNVI